MITIQPAAATTPDLTDGIAPGSRARSAAPGSRRGRTAVLAVVVAAVTIGAGIVATAVWSDNPAATNAVSIVDDSAEMDPSVPGALLHRSDAAAMDPSVPSAPLYRSDAAAMDPRIPAVLVAPAGDAAAMDPRIPAAR